MSEGGGKDGARKIPSLMLKLKEKGIEIMDLDVRADVPINFILPSGAIGSGYDATILPDICAVHFFGQFSFAHCLLQEQFRP